MSQSLFGAVLFGFGHGYCHLNEPVFFYRSTFKGALPGLMKVSLREFITYYKQQFMSECGLLDEVTTPPLPSSASCQHYFGPTLPEFARLTRTCATAFMHERMHTHMCAHAQTHSHRCAHTRACAHTHPNTPALCERTHARARTNVLTNTYVLPCFGTSCSWRASCGPRQRASNML